MSAVLLLVAPKESIDRTLTFEVLAYTFLLIALVFIPGVYLNVLSKPLWKYTHPVFLKKWGGLVEGLNVKTKASVFQPVLFIIRRLLFVSLAFFLPLTSIQIQVMNYINLFVFIYFGQIRPLENRKRNSLELFNEFIVLTLTVHLFCFSDMIESEDTKYLCGYSMIFLLALMMIVNAYMFLLKLINDIRLIGTKVYRLLKYKLSKL